MFHGLARICHHKALLMACAKSKATVTASIVAIAAKDQED